MLLHRVAALPCLFCSLDSFPVADHPIPLIPERSLKCRRLDDGWPQLGFRQVASVRLDINISAEFGYQMPAAVSRDDSQTALRHLAVRRGYIEYVRSV